MKPVFQFFTSLAGTTPPGLHLREGQCVPASTVQCTSSPSPLACTCGRDIASPHQRQCNNTTSTTCTRGGDIRSLHHQYNSAVIGCPVHSVSAGSAQLASPPTVTVTPYSNCSHVPSPYSHRHRSRHRPGSYALLHPTTDLTSSLLTLSPPHPAPTDHCHQHQRNSHHHDSAHQRSGEEEETKE